MQMSIIKIAHEKGHFALERIKENINKEFYVSELTKKIEKLHF